MHVCVCRHRNIWYLIFYITYIMYGCMEKTRYILDTIISRYVNIDNLDIITFTALQ